MKKLLLSAFISLAAISTFSTQAMAQEVEVKANETVAVEQSAEESQEKAVYNGWDNSYGSYYYYENG